MIFLLEMFNVSSLLFQNSAAAGQRVLLRSNLCTQVARGASSSKGSRLSSSSAEVVHFLISPKLHEVCLLFETVISPYFIASFYNASHELTICCFTKNRISILGKRSAAVSESENAAFHFHMSFLTLIRSNSSRADGVTTIQVP